MQEKPKPEDVEPEDTWSKDQEERGYYYDDAHGYEEYRPESDEEGNEGECAQSKEEPGDLSHTG